MKSRNNIAVFCSLLLWVAMLCACGSLRADQLLATTPGVPSGNSIEQLSGEVAGHPLAWLEQSVPPGAAAADHALPLLLLAYSLFYHSFPRLSRKPAKARLGFASLAAQFRILPNAP
ncbi:hypothetical protein ACFS7Z_22785 [Pontibacter toksunensis]|uniref:Lipoprotein n=1 Tax=Pontibacter toksunensis TaxID=1332631 RepID=A0ABW6C1W3_9BACT